MLPKLDEYPSVCLEHLERPERTPLVAGLEHVFPLVWVVDRVSLVERRPVAVVVLVLPALRLPECV